MTKLAINEVLFQVRHRRIHFNKRGRYRKSAQGEICLYPSGYHRWIRGRKTALRPHNSRSPTSHEKRLWTGTAKRFSTSSCLQPSAEAVEEEWLLRTFETAVVGIRVPTKRFKLETKKSRRERPSQSEQTSQYCR